MSSLLSAFVSSFAFSFAFFIIGLSSIYASNDDFIKLEKLASQRYGQVAQRNIQELNLLIQSVQSATDMEKLKKVNDFFNQKIRFTDDLELWGTSDYWATPLESIGRQAGDCEDFTIAKYVFLKMLNIDNNRMRLTYVRASLVNDGRQTLVAHMVLSYYATPQSEPLILDNLTLKFYLPLAEKIYPLFLVLTIKRYGLVQAANQNQNRRQTYRDGVMCYRELKQMD